MKTYNARAVADAIITLFESASLLRCTERPGIDKSEQASRQCAPQCLVRRNAQRRAAINRSTSGMYVCVYEGKPGLLQAMQ
jgi:hypothetical protein